MKQVAVVMLVILFLLSSQMENAQSQGQDQFSCYDYCSTWCALDFMSDSRRMQRCEIKCSIICSPKVYKICRGNI
ncbi:hypothetical protein ACHQM5_023671 [Ranunculus cassubicifolius]